MKKNLLMVLLCFCTSLAVAQLTATSEITLSTSPIYPVQRTAVWGDITGTGKLDIVSEMPLPESKYLGVIQDVKGAPSFTAQKHIAIAEGTEKHPLFRIA